MPHRVELSCPQGFLSLIQQKDQVTFTKPPRMNRLIILDPSNIPNALPMRKFMVKAPQLASKKGFRIQPVILKGRKTGGSLDRTS